ncbi:DNA polymerase alpha- subunit B [Apiospora rasikravindrae]|uniref:DNA polymerase alpha subunit B n=1 Tax=Apiospora rasikravindrae TaxID=990691 RepID=A0ABR1RSN4_9PEZI
MADADVQELNERFAVGDQQLEPDMLAELQSIMRMHSLSVQDLFFKWESYCIKMDMDEMRLSVENLRSLKREIQDALERENRDRQAHVVKTERKTGATPRTTIKNNAGDYLGGMLDGLATPSATKLNRNSGPKKKVESPSVTKVKSEFPSSSSNVKIPAGVDRHLDTMNSITAISFNDRQNAGEVIEILNDNLPAPETPIAPYPESRIKLTAASDQKKLAYKPLAMKLSEASEILDDRIDEFIGLVKDYHKLEDTAFGSAATQSTSEIYAVGRIASDSPEGKLNAASLVLEISRKIGGGRRIPLNLKKLPSYQFFPGQIVALKGINTSGTEFTVNEIIDIPLLPNAASIPTAIEGHRERLRGGPDVMESDDEPAPLSIVMASGPYTADDNLDFEPLHALCSQAADTYADALILCGPFIDVDHPLIAAGDFDLPEDAPVDPDQATMVTVFKYLIAPALNRLVAANPSVTILLVPSVRDVIDKHVSWPQDPFPRKELGLPKTCRIIGNPMTLSLNEVVLGVSSQDTLFELRHEELYSGAGRVGGADLLSRLPRHLIEQRHYCPVFPPVDRSKLPKVGTEDGRPVGAALDTSYLRLGDMVNVRPDMIMVPSSLPPFARVVESVLVVNPGYLSKRRGAGTYARVSLYPPKADEEEVGKAGMVSHKVFSRARVEITRI